MINITYLKLDIESLTPFDKVFPSYLYQRGELLVIDFLDDSSSTVSFFPMQMTTCTSIAEIR